MSHKALIFLSCGQRHGERELAKQIEKMLTDDLKFDCYNADSRQGFDDVMSITDHLARADYFLFIDFKRDVKRDYEAPISVFAHQEFALARAWQITEMLAFQEKGLKSCGMLGYVLAHPIVFDDRQKLVEMVKKEVKKKKWKCEYSRNLVPERLIPPHDKPVPYADHHGEYCERIWKVRVENRRTDRATLNTIAILDRVKNLDSDKVYHPDRTYLKWAEQQDYQRTIFPKDCAEIDAFALRKNQKGVFLHSASDVFPRCPILENVGKYRLVYFLYADTFSPVHFGIEINYDGTLKPTVFLVDYET